MNKYILIFLFFYIACDFQESNKHESLILNLIDDLNKSYTTEKLLERNFSFIQIKNDDDFQNVVIPIYDEVIKMLKKNVKKKNITKNIKIIKYKKDSPQFMKFKNVGENEFIYYVLTKDSLLFPVLFKENKIVSIITYKKNEMSEYSAFIKF